MKKILFATGNQGKMKEIREILGDLPCEILSLKDAGIHAEINEDGATFQENAIIKAETIAALLDAEDTLVLADDSGMEVDFLGGEPGVHSARFMGEDTSYDIKNAFFLKALEGKTGKERSARYVCVIAMAKAGEKTVTCTGILEGEIAMAPAGQGGFGYDPIFYLPEYHATTAELTPEQKNHISHRGKALEAMKEKIKEAWNL